jgi:membrane protein YqaA with SNARE-associated domain
MRTNVWLFFLLVSIAKTVRYIVVAMVTAAAF